jgi:hypothetical protein
MEDQPKREAESDRQPAEKPKGIKRVVSFVRSRSNVEKATALLVFILAFLWLVPELQVRYFAQDVDSANVPGLINEYRRTWAQILGGFGLFLGLYFAWRRVEISQRTLETQQDQQVTERFTRAIDQLGAATDDKESKPKIEIRLGGIYALERIAKDSPKRDYSTIVEVLCAYVRENARRAPVEGDKEQEALSRPPADIQAVLDVLKRLREDPELQQYLSSLDLRDTDLQGADLYRASLAEAILARADLAGTNLAKANLKGAELQRSRLTGANLIRTNLQGAILDEAELQEALLRITDLREANLEKSDLRGASFEMTDLRRASLSEADLREANFQGPLLQEAQLRGANLRGVAGLTQEQLEQAFGDEATELPEGFERPKSWIQGQGKQTDENE